MAQNWRIATYNLENFGASGRDDRLFARRIEALRENLRLLDADILCLQEVNSHKPPGGGPRDLDHLDALVRGTQYQHFRRAVSLRPGSSQPADIHNLVILSRWEIRTCAQVFHDFVPRLKWAPPLAVAETGAPVEVQWERPAQHAEILLPSGKSLHVVNVHLRAPRAAFIPGAKLDHRWTSSAGWAEGLYLAAMKRDGQALEVRLLVDRIIDGDPEARVAVCGDFNSEPRDIALRLIRAGRDELEEGWAEGRELTALEEWIAPADRYSVTHAGRRLLPDHILASQALARTCLEARIFNEGLADEGSARDGPVVGSFHAPIVAAFGSIDG